MSFQSSVDCALISFCFSLFLRQFVLTKVLVGKCPSRSPVFSPEFSLYSSTAFAAGRSLESKKDKINFDVQRITLTNISKIFVLVINAVFQYIIV
jgi:hypothetical protein